MIALSRRDIALTVAIVAAIQLVGWPVLNLLDRIVFGIECARESCQ